MSRVEVVEQSETENWSEKLRVTWIVYVHTCEQCVVTNVTLPQYVLLGLKSMNGIIKTPRPKKRALNVPSVLIVKVHIIGTRCWPV